MNIHHTAHPDKPITSFNEWCCYIRSQSLENRISDQLRENAIRQFNVDLNKLKR